MNSRQLEALAALLQHLEADDDEHTRPRLGWPVKILREFLTRAQGQQRVKTFLLLNGAYPVQSKFPLGQLLVTAGAHELVQQAQSNLTVLLQRHAQGDWGECGADERNKEYWSIWPLFSSYVLGEAQKVWIITEGDRRSTMILLPHEFDVLYASGQVSLWPDFGSDRIV